MEEIHMSGPQDLLRLLPHQFGFHPNKCIVAVPFKGRRMVGPIARLDLPPEHEAKPAAVALLDRLQDADTVVLIAYDDDERLALPAVDAAIEVARALDIKIAEVVVVRGDRYFLPNCTAPNCCPPDGRPLPEPGVEAAYVAHGSNPAASREDFREQLKPGPHADDVAGMIGGLTEVIREARRTGDREPCWEAIATAWRHVLDIETTPTLIDYAWALMSLEDYDVRDLIITRVVPGIEINFANPSVLALADALPEPPDNFALSPRLLELVQHAPAEVCTGALTVYANHTWGLGMGAQARLACEQALAVDPDYRLAQLVLRMVEQGIRPNK